MTLDQVNLILCEGGMEVLAQSTYEKLHVLWLLSLARLLVTK